MPKGRDHVAIGLQYVHDVVEGKVLACHWVKQACQRHLDDLERTDWAFQFDPERAEHFCRFVELLPHVKGRWATKTIVLEPWQCFVFSTIFGWINTETGMRRFRKALVVIPARNGKSALAATVGLYLLALDEENGAEVYSAATTRDQAKIVWETAKRMVEKSKRFQERYGVEAQAHSITVEESGSFFKALSRDADSLEGLNANGVIIDELAAHKTREVFDVLDERTGSRAQPLTLIISTEGDNPAGVFAEQVDYSQQILDRRHVDESYFGIIYTIDKDMDWTSREAWYCANPNLGVSVYEQDFADRCARAQKNPAQQSSFLTKRLNVRVGSGEAYYNVLSWNTICLAEEKLSLSDFEGRDCIIGLDLATFNDIAAKVYTFREGGAYRVFGKYYLPSERLSKENPNYDFYRGWSDREDLADVLVLSPGNVIDFEMIEADLVRDRDRFHIKEVAYDPSQATELSTRMMKEGLPMVQIQQRIAFMSEPMKKLGALIDTGKILHNGDPILGWMIGNTMAKKYPLDAVLPDKMRYDNKIDGTVATIMAIGRWICSADDNTYKYRPMRFLG